MKLPVGSIKPLRRDRKDRTTRAYWEHETALMRDIDANGMLNRLKVYPDGLQYQLLCGQTRLNAVIRLGWTEVPVEVIEGEMTESRGLQLEVADNQLQQGFDLFALADIATELMKLNGWTPAELCRNVPAINAATLSKTLSIAEGLSDELKAFLKDGVIGFRLAYALSRVPVDQQRAVYERVKDMRVEDAEAEIAVTTGKKAKVKSKAVKASLPGLTLVFTTGELTAARGLWDKVNAALQKLERTGFPLENLAGLLKQ